MHLVINELRATRILNASFITRTIVGTTCRKIISNCQPMPRYQIRSHSSAINNNKKTLKVVFITPEQENIVVMAKENQNLLDVAHSNNIELEGIHLFNS